MKKLFFTLTMCAGLLWSCSSDNDLDNDDNLNIPKGSIEFDISTFDEISTRTGRPLYSEEPEHVVSRMSVYVFKQTGSDYLFVKDFNLDAEWSVGQSSKCIQVPMGEQFTAGDYRFLAVGRDLLDAYTVNIPNGTNFNSVVVSLLLTDDATEIFSGYEDRTISAGAPGLRVKIIAKRKVAGILGYFQNVPISYGGHLVTGLKVMISNANKTVNLGTGEGSNPVGDWTTIINIPVVGQLSHNGIYNGNVVPLGVEKLPDSQLQGGYALPVQNIQMKVVLYGLLDETLHEWTIKDGENSTFSLEPNHFYSLGKKPLKDSTTDDRCINLLNDQEICIEIDPVWGSFHYLDLVQ